MKKFQALIIITSIISLIELVYLLTTNMPISYAQRIFTLFLVIVEFIGLGEIWSRKKSQHLKELQTWPLDHDEKEW